MGIRTAAAFLVWLGPGAIAHADRTLVLVSAREAPSPEVRDLASRLGRDLSALGPAEAVAAIESAYPPPSPASWDGAELLAKVAAARDDYYDGRFAKAAPALGAVQGEIRARIDRIGADDRLATPLFASQMMHAIALVRTGRTDEATDVLRDAHVLFPERRPSTTEFGPELVRLWGQGVPAASGDASVRVEAVLGRRPCRVRWNGRDAGPSPAALRMPPGRAVLQATCGDAESRLRQPLVARGALSIRIDVGVDAAIETSDWIGIRSRGDEDDRHAAAAIGAATGASRVALLFAKGREVRGVLLGIDRRGRPRTLREAAAEVGDAESLAALSDALAGPVEEPAAGDSGPPTERGSAWWIAAGAGGIASIAGSALFAIGRSNAIDALSSSSGDARADREAAAGTELALGAYLLPAGVGALLSGAALYLLPPNGRGVLGGPVYVAMLAGGAVLAGLGVSLLLQDECESFDALCTAQGSEPGPSTSPLSYLALGLGAASAGGAIALRLREDP